MNNKTVEQIDCFLFQEMPNMDMPYAYYGDEPNLPSAPAWKEAKLRFCLASSWSYAHVTGAQSIPLLHQLVANTDPDVLCDRSYFPYSKKDLSLFDKHSMPLFGLAQRQVLGQFDVLGTSLGFICFYPNFVRQLKMSGIPVRWRDRVNMEEEYPVIMAGGMLYGSPEIWSEVVDLVWIGEAEDEPEYPGIQEFCRFTRDWKQNEKFYTPDGRLRYLIAVCKRFDFLYSPRLAHPLYDDNKRITGFEYTLGVPKPKRKFVRNMDIVPALTELPVSYHEPSMGCVSGNSLICVKDRGILRIEDAVAEDIEVWDGSSFVRASVKPSGKKRKAIVRTNFGQEIVCSPDHRFLSEYGGWIEAQNLQVGKRVRVNSNVVEDFVGNLDVKYDHCEAIESVALLEEKIEMFDVVNSESGQFVVDGFIVHNSGEVEGGRGCSGSCAFCSIAFRCRPYRQRSVPVLVDAIKKNFKNTGADVAFTVYPDFSCYTQKRLLVKTLMEEVCSNVDTQGGRVDNFADDPSFGLLAAEGKMNQWALGVEGTSERMRVAVNKNCTRQDLLFAVETAIKCGFKRIKMYLIPDLPFEEEADVLCFVGLCKEIVSIKEHYGSGAQIIASFTPFLNEANTPLQWYPCTLEKKTLYGLPDELRKLGVNFRLGKKTEPNYAYFMQACHFMDRIMASCMLKTIEELDMVYFTGVNRKFKETMEKYLAEAGVDWDHYFSAKPDDFIFPHEIVDIGVSKEYLFEFYKRIKKFIADTPDPVAFEETAKTVHYPMIMSKCNDCSLCGNCDSEMLRYKAGLNRQKDIEVELSKINKIDQDTIASRFLMEVEVDEEKRFVVNEHWEFQIRRACYMEDYPVAVHSIKFESSSVKFKPWFSGIDYTTIGFTVPYLLNDAVVDRINFHLKGIKIKRVIPIVSDFRFGSVGNSLWRLQVRKLSKEIVLALTRFKDKTYIPMTVKTNGFRGNFMTAKVNLKDYIDDVWFVVLKGKVFMRFLMRKSCSPYDVYSSLFERGISDVMRYSAIREAVIKKTYEGRMEYGARVCPLCGVSVVETLMGDFLLFCPKCSDVDKKGLLAGIFGEKVIRKF